MNRIIIATDFSKASMNASEYGVSLAVVLNVKVLLVHVYTIPLSAPESFVIVVPDEVKRLAEDYLRSEVKRLKQGRDLDIGYLALEGNVVARLLQLTGEWRDALLVTAIKMEENPLKRLFGNTNTGMLGQTNAPMLSVPEQASDCNMRKIAWALEHSTDVKSDLMDFLLFIGEHFKTKIFIIKVLEPGASEVAELNFRSELLNSKFEKMNLEYVFLRSSNVSEAIDQFSLNNEIDMLIVNTRHHHFIDKLFNRSEARKLIFHSHIPVLFFPTTTTFYQRPFPTLQQQHS